MKDPNARIKQLTNLILTSQTVGENRGDESRPASPSKVDFDMTPYQVRASSLSHPPLSQILQSKLTRTNVAAPTRAPFRTTRDRIASNPNPRPRSDAPRAARAAPRRAGKREGSLAGGAGAQHPRTRDGRQGLRGQPRRAAARRTRGRRA